MNKGILIISMLLVLSACDRVNKPAAVVEVYRADVYEALNNYDAELDSLLHVASGDINNNGKSNLVLLLIDEAKTGNYRAYSTLVAYDVDLTKPLIQAKPVSN